MYYWILWVGRTPLPFRTDSQEVPDKAALKALLARKNQPGGSYSLRGPFATDEFEDLIPAATPEPSSEPPTT